MYVFSNKLIHFTFFAFLFVCFFSANVRSEIPVPNSKKEVFEATKVLADRKNNTVLRQEKELSSLGSELNKLQIKLKNKVVDIEKNEANIKKINSEISEIAIKKTKQLEKLDEAYAVMRAAIRLKINSAIMPESFFLFQENGVEEHILQNHAIKSVFPMLQGDIDVLKKDLEDLNALKEKLEVAEKKQAKEIKKLRKNKDILNSNLKLRETAQKKLQQNYEQAAAEAKEAARLSKNLEELIQRIEKQESLKLQKRKKAEIDRKQQQKRAQKTTINSTVPKKPLSYTTAYTLPVSAKIDVSFAGKDLIGARSKGVSFVPTSNAIVVSPKPGKIKYAGAFQKYQKIILVEHEKNYFSLIAGLTKIDTVVGQKVIRGEPLGKADNNPVYYELRMDGKPVDPTEHLKLF